jgi:hypothetical protein
MKNQIKSLLLVAFVLGTVIPAWGQASTEGKDFWVANTIVCQPPTASSAAYPTIAVSAQKACTVTITDYAGNQLITANVAAGSWTRFGDNNAAVDPADYALAPARWYPTTDNVNATDVYKHADKINNYGLHITATENISVYVIMRTPQYSMDASNALPVTALQSEYYLQDFYPDANGVDKPVTMTTILAIENNTNVVITPKGNTYGKTNNGTPYTVTLQKGQTYYMISEVNSQLAGTHIVAQDDKKIAVYVGSPVTRLPGGVAARDGLFEQMMPTVYWGTQFIATRSLQKDANIIGITATQNGTEIKMDGYTQTYINEGETYYILLQSASDPYAAKLSNITCSINKIVTADAAYIETSCPCAVINYDTGNSFAGRTGSEIVNGQGDPSSVWISPIQQKINRITFGACYTKMTKAHFLNVVTETATCSNTKLTAYMGQNSADWSNKLVWTVVPGNPAYSYARVQIGNDQPDINVFTLENSKGFIAHVYGNGEDESYAYSAGSAAVEQGVNVNGETFTNGYRSDSKFCMADVIQFDAGVGTDEISRVDWNFGDGTSEDHSTPQKEHQYMSPGWYDVSADLYGHQVCTDESEQFLGTVRFSFRVVQQDTLPGTAVYHCLSIDTLADNPERRAYLLQYGENDTITPEYCYDPVYINYVVYGEDSTATITAEGRDSVKVNGQTYYITQDISYIVPNPKYPKCDLSVFCHVHVIQCLDMTFNNVPEEQHICPGDALSITYSKTKGDIDGAARFVIPGVVDELVDIDNRNVASATISLPTYVLQKPGKYQAQLIIPDMYCDTISFPIDFTVYYPSDIFKRKFNNVLAVYNKQYNGGYDFAHYEWHLIRNGQDTIIGGDQSVYHQDMPFEQYDAVYVVLTDNNGFTLPSCPQVWENVPDLNDQQNNAPAAQKVIRNNRMCIRIDGRIYDMYGQRVE